jgi:hypothetical protein
MSECFQLLGFPEHAIEHLNNATKCLNCPIILHKKLALVYESIGNSKSYLSFYSKYFELSLINSKNDEFEVKLFCLQFFIVLVGRLV